MKLKKISLISSFIFLTFIFVSCNDVAKNNVVKKIATTDGEYTAVAFIRDAGATTPFSPQVSILKKGEKFGDSNIGNVFIGNKSKDIDIKWEDSKSLIISLKGYEKIKEENKFEYITIKYINIED